MDFIDFIQKRFPWVEIKIDDNPSPEKIASIKASIERNKNRKPILRGVL